MDAKKTEVLGDQLSILRWLYTYTLRDLEIAPYLVEEGCQSIQHNVVDKNKFGIQILEDGYDEEEVVKNLKDEDLSILFIVDSIEGKSSFCLVEGKCIDSRLKEYFLKLWDALLINFTD